VVIATSQPEEALQEVAAAAEPLNPQAVDLESADINNPTPEADTLETGTNDSSSPRTRVSFSEVD
jgi:hypothetical protein